MENKKFFLRFEVFYKTGEHEKCAKWKEKWLLFSKNVYTAKC